MFFFGSFHLPFVFPNLTWVSALISLGFILISGIKLLSANKKNQGFQSMIPSLRYTKKKKKNETSLFLIFTGFCGCNSILNNFKNATGI